MAVIAFGAPSRARSLPEAITECGLGGLKGLGGESEGQGGR